MAHPDPAARVTVFDSEGVRGSLAADALHGADEQILITFEAGRRVQLPRELLRQREDGSYTLPVSLRELGGASVTLQRADDGNVVAVIPVVLEELQVGKRQVETGRVRIHKRVETREEQVDVPLLREQVQVERVAVERYLDKPVKPHYQGETLVIPVMEEVLVVEKRLLLREEIRVTTVREEHRHQESVTLQQEQVTVARTGAHADAQTEPERPAS